MSHCVPHAPLEQTWPLPQPVPSVTLLHAVVLVPGWQLWQALFGFGVVDVKKVPPMKQPAVHAPAVQTLPDAQLVPSVRLLHAVVLVAGWQLWQALAEFTAAGA